MPTIDSRTGPVNGHARQPPRAGPLLDLPTYERFIEDGIADADARGTPVDHVTARRLGIWLAARPQSPVFARSLVQFVKTGAITQALRTQLRIHARSGNYPDRPQSACLMEYCIARGAQTGPVGEDFGAICDQIDRADVMLADLRNRVRYGWRSSRQPSAEADGPQVIAVARRDPQDRAIITIVMDAATANVAMYAITAHAREREAHLREVERYGEALPEDSYGRANRQAIAAREARLAARLRAVEHAYRTALDPEAGLTPTDHAQALRSVSRASGWEPEPD
jgi:hypothetical protein